MWIEIHDLDGRIEIDELTAEGATDAIYQCEQLIEELKAVVESDED